MTAVIRACGTRVAGGVYLTVATGESGFPLEHFLIDPPIPIDMNALGVSPLGVTLVAKTENVGEVVHVLDVVGENNYPNVADILEEGRRYGFSRRIARTTDFSRLTIGSRLILIHARAFIENSASYHMMRPKDEFWCPKDIPKHLNPHFTGMCSSLFYEDVVEGATPSNDPDSPDGMFIAGKRMSDDMPGVHMHRRRFEQRSVVREMPSFAYRALGRPTGIAPKYQYAMFLSLPIGRIEVIRDRAGGSHVEAMEKASRANGLEVVEVDE